jgi:hypothetical protein
MVPQRPAMADRVRGTLQLQQAPRRSSSIAAIEVVMQRWVGLGVIADNLINVDLAISKQSAK